MNMTLIMAMIVHCYVGCHPGSSDQQAIHVLECDTETGAAKIVQSVKGIEGTTYFQIDRDRKHLYSVLGERRDGKSRGAVIRFALDGWKIGAMERLCDLPCEAPCHVSLTPDETRVAFAAYTSATAGTVGVDGKGLATFVFPDDAMGPNRKRQQKAYAHQTFHLPDGRLGIVDLGCDRIWFFDPKTMARDGALVLGADPGDGPRHAILSRDRRFLFVLNELGSSVASYDLSGISNCKLQIADGQGQISNYKLQIADGQIAKGQIAKGQGQIAKGKIGKWSMLPRDFNRWESDGETLATKAAAIKLTADGKILMASNRGHDSIAFFSINGDGTLTLKNIAKLTGRFPRDFELLPGEKFMVVGHKMSDEIQIYRFDRAECTLSPVGAPIPCYHPLCFKF